jgi:hypothetical protein
MGDCVVEYMTSKNRLALLEKCAALLWDAQDMMNDGPDESDVAYAQGKCAEAVEVAREIHRLPDETSPKQGRYRHMKELADPTPTDAVYIARLRKDYESACAGKSDEQVMDYFNPAGYRYVECTLWDNLKDAAYDFEQLADAYMKLKRAAVETKDG